jgi:hypothetical protein
VLTDAGAKATLSDFRDAGLWDHLRPRRKPAA